MAKIGTQLAIAVVCSLFASTQSIADVPFKRHANGDLTILIKKITRKHLRELQRDIPGNQGKCVRFAVLDFQEYEISEALMRIPAERHGIEFEPRGDGVVQLICGRFGEDQFDWAGKATSSLEYEAIEGY